MRKSREEILQDNEEELNARSNSVSMSQSMDSSDMEESSNSTDDQNTTEEAKMCGPPSITDGALVYK